MTFFQNSEGEKKLVHLFTDFKGQPIKKTIILLETRFSARSSDIVSEVFEWLHFLADGQSGFMLVNRFSFCKFSH
jgi:hypothetical protein